MRPGLAKLFDWAKTPGGKITICTITCMLMGLAMGLSREPKILTRSETALIWTALGSAAGLVASGLLTLKDSLMKACRKEDQSSAKSAAATTPRGAAPPSEESTLKGVSEVLPK